MSWLETELREQPDALARFLRAETAAARYAQYLFGAVNRLPVALATPSLYTLYRTPPRLESALVVGISQSGASPDIAAVVSEARSQGCPTIAITNDPTSRLAVAAERVVALWAGKEQAVAAAKTYLNSNAAVAPLSAALGDDEERLDELLGMPARVREQIVLSESSIGVLDRFRDVAAGTV